MLPLDFSTFGNADLRLPTVKLHHADGTEVSRFCYRGHKIYKGKPRLSGLPATYVEQEDEANTLELELFDSLQGISVTLIYTAFTKLDAITRSLRIENQSPNTANIKTALSATVDFTAGKDRFDLIHLELAKRAACSPPGAVLRQSRGLFPPWCLQPAPQPVYCANKQGRRRAAG